MPILEAWTQTVSITNGPADALVRNLAIRRSTDERVTTCDFVVENDPAGQATFDACVLGERIVVSQVGASATVTFRGDIVSVRDERGENWTQRKVKAYSDEARAKWTRFQAQWDNERADTIVSQAWSAYGAGVAPGGVSIASNAQRLDLTSSFDSLFDLMETVCQRTAWAWRIDAATGVMEFFDPLGRNSPSWSQTGAEIEGGTLIVSRDSEQVVNVARTPVWLYRRRNKTVHAELEDCIPEVRATDILAPRQWDEVSEVEIIQDFAKKGIDRTAELTEDGWLRFDPPLDPLAQAPADEQNQGFTYTIEVELTWKRQVWLVAEAPDSIAEYGRREGQPINDDGGQTEDEGLQRLTEYLARNAYPTLTVKGGALEIGYAPDTICNVSLNDPPLAAPLYVTSVRHTTGDNDLDVQIDLASPDTVLDDGSGQRPVTRELDVIDELHRRIIQLERRDAHPLGVLGITTSEIGSLKASDATRVGTGWGERVTASNIGPNVTEDAWGVQTETVVTLPNLQDRVAPAGSTGWNDETTALETETGITEHSIAWSSTTTARKVVLATGIINGSPIHSGQVN